MGVLSLQLAGAVRVSATIGLLSQGPLPTGTTIMTVAGPSVNRQTPIGFVGFSLFLCRDFPIDFVGLGLQI